MNVLVTAASKHGATAEIAGAIADQLRGHGIDVTAEPPDAVGDIDGFDAVVLGSAVYAGHWMKPALEFVDRFGEAFASRPVWIFSSGPIGDPPKPEEDPVDVATVMDRTGARDHRLFAGKLDKSSLGFAERAIVTALRAAYGDFRDWSEIGGWASTIAESLVRESAG